MTEAVTEAALVFAAVNNAPGDGVKLGAGDALSQRLLRRRLGGKHSVIQPLHVPVRLADDHRSRHIRAVAVVQRAVVHGEKALFQLHVSRDPVGQGRSASRNGDGIKAGGRRAAFPHEEFQLQRDLHLGAVGRDEAEDMVKRLFGDPLGGDDVFHFLLVLVFPQILD